MTDPATISSPAANFVHTWATSLGEVLGQIAGAPFRCAVADSSLSEVTAPGAGDLWVAAAWSGGVRGEMSLRLPPASALRLAQVFTGETIGEPVAAVAEVAPGEVTPDHGEAILELLRQAGGLMCSALKGQWGEAQLRLDRAAGAPSWPASSTAWLVVGTPPETALIEIQLSAALAATLRTEPTEPAAALPPVASQSPAPSQLEAGSGKLELLMDVELAVTLRFGSRRLPLREVLDLIPGAVVDLDRQVDEPVDVILDGRVVARGEIVVFEGNYGVRVTEVAPPAG